MLKIKLSFISLLYIGLLLSCNKEKEEIKISTLLEDDFSFLRGADVSFIPEIR